MPQYRLKAIEECRLSEVRGETVDRYAQYLKLEEWLKSWVAANPRLAAKLKVNSAPRATNQGVKRGAVRGGPSNKPLQLPGAARDGR